MPLIKPQFNLSQDDQFVKISLRLPYVKVNKSEFSILKNEFSFFLKPYLLQLQFEECLKEQEYPQKLVYDPETFNLDIYLTKLNVGEEFKNLNMLTLLQKDKKSKKPDNMKNKNPLIEVIGEVDDQVQINEDKAVNLFGYGFNQQYFNVFDDLEEELLELCILNPRDVPNKQRLAIGVNHIKNIFDPENYIDDLFYNGDIDQILEYKLFTDKQQQYQFTNEEIKILSDLPKKEYIIQNQDDLLFGLFDVLFALTYELNLMEGELSNESATTINALSSLFQCLETADNIRDALIQSYQRCLSIPMIRSFEICLKVKDQISDTFKDKILILKQLIKLKRLFQQNKPRDLLNLLFVDDYLIFIQRLKEQELKQFQKQIEQTKIDKDDLQLNISKIEQEAILKLNQ
ncbi:hypothetical protein pb186bvf_002960 [Paramecium bursaria]